MRSETKSFSSIPESSDLKLTEPPRINFDDLEESFWIYICDQECIYDINDIWAVVVGDQYSVSNIAIKDK